MAAKDELIKIVKLYQERTFDEEITRINEYGGKCPSRRVTPVQAWKASLSGSRSI